jgi:hypothetical protein
MVDRTACEAPRLDLQNSLAERANPRLCGASLGRIAVRLPLTVRLANDGRNQNAYRERKGSR